MCMETVAAVLAGLKDLALGGAAVTTAVVAIKGLAKWRQELEGKAGFDAARNLVKATYRLRDEIKLFRHPFISGHEFSEEYNAMRASRTADVEARGWQHVFLNRFKSVSDALREFDTHSLEAEALWGKPIRTKTDALRSCLQELHGAVPAFISDKHNGGQDFATDRNFGKKIRAILHGSADDMDNPLSKSIAAAIAGIDDELVKHLRRK